MTNYSIFFFASLEHSLSKDIYFLLSFSKSLISSSKDTRILILLYQQKTSRHINVMRAKIKKAI